MSLSKSNAGIQTIVYIFLKHAVPLWINFLEEFLAGHSCPTKFIPILFTTYMYLIHSWLRVPKKFITISFTAHVYID